MLLSDAKILQAIAKGNIVIEPFDERCLNTNSFDVRLGEWFFSPTDSCALFDITKQEDVEAFWGKPRKADKFIDIRPGDTILAHTQEVIGGRNGYTTSMRSRSSIVRCGLSVCKCGGLGDVGFISKWTMELSNHGRSYIRLRVGMRIAQVEFHYVGKTFKEYAGKYGQGEWSPSDLIPRLYNDWDIDDIRSGKYCGN